MRKIVTAAFVSIDGVMQAPGAPEEDPSGGFKYGGWIVPYFDEVAGAAIDELFSSPFDLLLGRRTYDIFAAHWPYRVNDPDEGNAKIAKRFNEVTKYVATHRPDSLTWERSRALGDDVVGALRELKRGDGPKLLTQGSSALIQTLLANDLIDELHVLTFPITLGRGKRLFADGTRPAAFELVKSKISPRGTMIATYQRAGDVQTGSFAQDTPSAAELERRKHLR
jgi:dihydrofolate reductase